MNHQRLIEIFVISLLVVLVSCNGQLSRHPRQTRDKTSRLPGLDVCGPSVFTFGTKVIDGEPAELGEFPWMAVIGYVVRGSTQIYWQCGGSLITDRFVLSAAHCFHPSVLGARRTPFKATAVRLGELNLDPTVADGAEPQDIEIDDIKYHEQYDNVKKINDIALIRLKEQVVFTNNIKPICLPPAELYQNLYVGFHPTVAGWGKSDLNDTRRDPRLLKAELEIKDTESCRTNVTSLYQLRNAVIDKRVVCASAPGKDSCQGDSGGPLMFFTKIRNTPAGSKGNFFIMGIVSYGYKCAVDGYPGVYTRVSEYMHWIISNLVF